MSKYLIFLLSIFLLIGSVSAFDFDNVKSFDSTKSDYGEITVTNAFGLGETLATYTLINNTDFCIGNCEAVGKATLYTDNMLFTKLELLNMKESGDADIYILKEVIVQELYTDYKDTKEVCDYSLKDVTPCYDKPTDKYRNVTRKQWELYNGEVLDAGDYEWKVKGSISFGEQVDWVVSGSGEKLTEWAWWNATMPYQRVLNFTTGDAITTNFTHRAVFEKDSAMGDNCENMTLVYKDTTEIDSDIRVCNATAVEVAWREQNGLGSGIYDANITVYYGEEITRKQDRNVVYVWNDDMTASNSSKYRRFDSPGTFQGGVVNITADTRSGVVGNWNATNNFTVEMSVDLKQSTGGQLYFGASFGQMWVGSDGINIGGNNVRKLYKDDSGAAGVDGSNVIGAYTDGFFNYSIFVNNTIAQGYNDSLSLGNPFATISFTPSTRVGASWTNADDSVTWAIDWIRMFEDIGVRPSYALSDEETLGIVVSYPEDSLVTSDLTPSFGCNYSSVDSSNNLTDVALNIYNSSGYLSYTNSESGLNLISYNKSWTSSALENDIYSWACTGSFATSAKSSKNRTLMVDSTAPSLTIFSPSGSQGSQVLPYNVTLNYTASDTNLQSCWYNGTWNSTIVYLTCNQTLDNLTISSGGSQVIYLYANDSIGNQLIASSSFYPSVTLNSLTYSEKTYETAKEIFIANITYNNSAYNSVTGNLNYNGINYSLSSIGTGNNVRFSKTIDIPALSSDTAVNNSFYWIFDLTNATGTETFLSDIFNQTVDVIKFSLCNSTQVPFINFSTYSSENPFPSVLATFKSSWIIRLANSTGSKTVNASYEDISETNNTWSFCLEPEDREYTISSAIEYDGSDYAKNFYYLTDANYTNQTTNVSLYLLNDTKATLTVLEVVDKAYKGVSDVYVQIQFYDVGTDTFYTVANAKTDYAGEDLIYLNWYDSLYKFVLVKDGQVVQSTSPYKISSTPQTFQINIGGLDSPYQKFEDFEYDLYYNNITQNFVLTFVKPSGLVDSACLKVVKRNITDDYIVCETCETSSSATLYCNIAPYGNGTYIANFYATGSLKVIDGIIEVVGYLNSIYEEIGNIDGTALAIIFSGIVVVTFAVSPMIGVLAMMGGMIASFALGFQPLEYGSFVGIVLIGFLVIWILKR